MGGDLSLVRRVHRYLHEAQLHTHTDCQKLKDVAIRTTPCDKFGPLFPLVYGSTRVNKQNANASTPSTSQKQLHESGLQHTWMTQDSHPNQ